MESENQFLKEVNIFIRRNWRDLFNETEKAAYLTIIGWEKIKATENKTLAKEIEKSICSDNPEVIALAEKGIDYIFENVRGRLQKENSQFEQLNFCPKCNALARTMKAKQCPKCFFSWYSKIYSEI